MLHHSRETKTGNRPFMGTVALLLLLGCDKAKSGGTPDSAADGKQGDAATLNPSGNTGGTPDSAAGGKRADAAALNPSGITDGRPGDAGQATLGQDGTGGQAGLDMGGRAGSGGGGTTDGGASRDSGRGPEGPAPFLDASSNLGPAAVLNGQRWTTPCLKPEKNNIVCDTPSVCPAGGFTSTMKSINFVGTADTTYDVRVRVRGVMEPKHYTGGMALGNHIYSGGQVGTSVYNIVSLAISAPAHTYYLNHDDNDRRGEQHYVNQVDHVFTIRIAAGATLTLRSHDPNCSLIRNCMAETGTCVPYTFPDLPVPAGYDGQWAQIDVLSIIP